MAKEIVNRQVNIYIQSGEAQKVYDTLISKQKKLNEELTAAGTHPKRIQAINAELKKLEEPISRAAKKLSGELNPTFNDLQKSASRLLAEFKKTGDPKALEGYTKLNAQLNLMKGEMKSLEQAQGSFGKTGFFSAAFWANLAAQGVTRAASAIGSFFKGTVQEALDADEATRRLESTLSNLGRSDAFDRITRKAQEMANKFRYLDNDDVVGVFNKLIDYGKLTEKEMNDLLPVIIDFAAKTNQNLGDATSVIIKALEGNGKALKEFGINIKDTGDETERLNLLMTTLKGKVDGSADAFQNSAKGGLAVARQEFKNLQEDIGNLVIPALNTLLGWVVKALNGIKEFAQSVRAAFSSAYRQKLEAQADTEIATGAADKQYNDFIKSIEKLAGDKRKKALQDEIENWEYRAKIFKEQDQDIKASGKMNDALREQNRQMMQSHQLIIARLKEEMNNSFEGNTLGIDAGDGKDKTDKKSVSHKEEKKDIDALAEAWKRLAEIKKMSEKGVSQWSSEQRTVLREAYKTFEENIKAIQAITPLDAEKQNKLRDRDRIAQMELNVQTSRGKARLQNELKLLKEQERQELQQKDLTENEKLLIEEKYRQRRSEAETTFYQALADNIMNYAGTILNILSTIDQARTNAENAELEADRRRNDIKRNNLDRRLKSGAISQKEYDKQLAEIDKQQRKRENEIEVKQFRRQQRMAILNTIMNAAQGIISTFAAKPGATDIISLGAFRAIQIGIIAATTAAQLAVIASQKPPQYAQGGKLGGRLHSEGGNPILDGHGRKIGEIEKGEGIINRRSMSDSNSYTITGTPSQIGSAINGLHGGHRWDSGARIIPGWMNRQPVPFNFPVIQKYYAAGGMYGGNGNAATTADTAVLQQMTAVIADMQLTNAALAEQLSRGIYAYSLITEQEKQQNRLNAIRDDATMK